MPVKRGKDETNGKKIQWSKCYRVTDKKGEHVDPNSKDAQLCFTDMDDWNNYTLHKFAFWRGFTGIMWALLLGLVVGTAIVYLAQLPIWILAILLVVVVAFYVHGERMERIRWGGVDEDDFVNNKDANARSVYVKKSKSKKKGMK